MSDGGKGSGRRPGDGYAAGWDAIFGKKKVEQNNREIKEHSADSFENSKAPVPHESQLKRVSPNKQPL